MRRTRIAAVSFFLLFVSFGLLNPASAAAQQGAGVTIEGRVVNASGTAIAGVDVSLPELSRSARTNDAGDFSFSGIKAGERTIVFTRAGYTNETRVVSVPLASALVVTLRESAFRISSINVTAMRSPVIAAHAPLSTATLDADQLRRFPTVSLSHALEQLAGVHTLATGQEMGKPVIRGLTGSRVLVTDNGHRMEDYSWSDEDGPSVDSRLAERVELVRGPASVLYGSDAISGVVNVVPAPLPSAIDRPSFKRFGIEAYGATNNVEAGTVLRAEGASNAFGYRGVGIIRKSEAIHTPDGELENTGYFAVNGELAAGIQKSWGNAALRVARYGGEFKLLEAGGESPVHVEVPGEEEGGPVRKLGDNRVQLDFNRLFGGVRLETKAQWQMHELAEVEEEGEGGGGKEGEVEGLELVLNTMSLDMLLHHSLGGKTTGVFGITGVHQSNDTKGLIPFIPDATRNSAALYALEQWTSGRLTLVGSARGDVASVKTDGNAILGLNADSRDFNAVTYSAGAVLQVAPQIAITGNVGRAWRAPNFFELYANGPQLGEARYVRGSNALQEEKSLGLDGGIRLSTPRVHAEFAAFSNRMDNYIYLQPTQQQIDSLQLFNYLQADARLNGGEMTAEIEAMPSLTLRGRADIVRGTNRATSEPLPLIPPRALEGGAELHGAFAGMDRAYLSADVENHATPTRMNPEDYVTQGYTLLNAGAGFDRRVGAHNLHVDLRIHNALNKSYKDFLYRYKQFALNPGRDIMLRASLDF